MLPVHVRVTISTTYILNLKLFVYTHIYIYTMQYICEVLEFKWIDVNWVQMKHCLHGGAKAHGSMLLYCNA